MTDPRDAETRATRLAANVALLAIGAWALLYLVSTQVVTVRAASAFSDDPWDLVASYAAIVLPIVVGATFVRSVRHRGPHLPPATARRIRIGVAIILAVIGINVAADGLALLSVPLPVPAAATDGRLALLVGLVLLTGITAAAAGAFVVRAHSIRPRAAPMDSATEPDLLDDLLGLAGGIPVLARLVGPVERFLATSSASPRRHRLIFGLLAAVLAGLAFDALHTLREGPWASPAVLVLFAALTGIGVLGGYLLTLEPLRLIRPAR